MAILAMASLVAWAIARAHLESLPPQPVAPGLDALAAVVKGRPAAVEIDLAARFGNDLDRVDPRAALPSWHQYPRDLAVGTAREASRSCAQPALPAGDGSLGKWIARHFDARRDVGAFPGE